MIGIRNNKDVQIAMQVCYNLLGVGTAVITGRTCSNLKRIFPSGRNLSSAQFTTYLLFDFPLMATATTKDGGGGKAFRPSILHCKNCLSAKLNPRQKTRRQKISIGVSKEQIYIYQIQHTQPIQAVLEWLRIFCTMITKNLPSSCD